MTDVTLTGNFLATARCLTFQGANGASWSFNPNTNALTVSLGGGTGIALEDLTDVSIPSPAQGDVIYYNGTDWVALTPGTSGQFLETKGANANPVWGSVSLSFENLSDVSISSPAQGDIVYYNGSDWVVLAPGTANYVLATGGANANPSWVAASGGASGANPTASVGLSAVNGSAATFLRSDGAPALSQAISPTWTAAHTFTPGSAATAISINAKGSYGLSIAGAANNYCALFTGNSTAGESFGTICNAGTNSSDYCTAWQNAAGSTLFGILYGNGGLALGTPTGGTKGLGTVNVSGGYYVNGVALTAGGGASNITQIVQTGGASQNYSVPANATFLRVYLIGGGGGGGGGGKTTTATNIGGGGGGASGCMSVVDLLAADVSGGLTVVFSNASGGAGGAGATTAASGSTGTAGSNVTLENSTGQILMQANGGNAGTGGSTSGGGNAGTTSSVGTIFTGTNGGAGGATGTGSAGTNLSTLSDGGSTTVYGSTGGGGGAGGSGAAGAAGAAGGGSNSGGTPAVTVTGGIAGTAGSGSANGGTGGTGTQYTSLAAAGGGGGGSASGAHNGGNGGPGSGYGAGGGGGGACYDSTGGNGGTGGQGGYAAAIILAW